MAGLRHKLRHKFPYCFGRRRQFVDPDSRTMATRRNPCPISRATPEPLREGAPIHAPLATQAAGEMFYNPLIGLPVPPAVYISAASPTTAPADQRGITRSFGAAITL